MNPALLGASVVASFLGGILALIAPCCVSFVFPAYFASAFREKSKILQMTMIFFVGMAIVLVPVALGLQALAQLIARFHYEVFLTGGIFLIILGVLSLFGKTIPMPFKRNPNLQKSDPFSVFLLGVLSGAASTCCTPVLIGVLTITALSGTFLYALILSLTYVLGIVSPLILMSLLWDRYDFSKAKWLKGRMIGKIHSTHLISAILFGGMGLLIVILTVLGKTAMIPSYQKEMSNLFFNLTTSVASKTQIIPEYIWVILIILIFLTLFWLAFRPSKIKERGKGEQ